MESNKLHERVTTIDTILNINKSTPSLRGGKGFMKSIPIRYQNSSDVYYVDEDIGYGSISDVFQLSDNKIMNENINNFRILSNLRERQYQMYEELSEDSIISSVLDLYAEDATQSDIKGNIMWMQGDDHSIESIVQSIFEGIDIEKDLWQITRMLALYGDVYLELFYDKAINSADVRLVESVEKSNALDYCHVLTEVDKIAHNHSDGYILSRYEIVRDVENMFDLVVQGKTVAFARVMESNAINRVNGGLNSEGTMGTGYYTPSQHNNAIRYYPRDKFIHFYIDDSTSRNFDMFVVDVGDGKQFRFQIRRGRSMIHDVYTDQRDLQLLEYSIMLNRVSRSSILRVVQVEVGNMSKTNVNTTLRKIKQLIESKVTLNSNSGEYSQYMNPGPIENFIYVPTKDGQGAISFNTVGGDVNIKDIADLEYYQNKLFAGLKVPKTYLNYTEAMSTFGSGGALTKQDARYARTIKRLQGFIRRGIYDLMDIYLDNRGLSHLLNKYKVMMVVPSSIEDEERDELFSNRMELTKSFMEILNSLDEHELLTLKMDRALEYISTEIFNDPTIKDLFEIKEDDHMDMGDEGGMGDISGQAIEVDEPQGSGFSSDVDSSSSTVTRTPSNNDTTTNAEFGGEWQDIEI